MDTNEIILTPEGRQKLVDELEWREGEKDAEIIERIKEARGFGDLSENSEYDDAKEEQAKNAARITEIRKILSIARVSDDHGGKGSNISTTLGCTVELKDEAGKKHSYTIVGTTETDSLRGRISNESPMGRALIGTSKGDTVVVRAPSGTERSFTVLNITR